MFKGLSWKFLLGCQETNLGHALLLLLREGADYMRRLGEDVLRNLSHNIRHRVEVADHLDQCLASPDALEVIVVTYLLTYSLTD